MWTRINNSLLAGDLAKVRKAEKLILDQLVDKDESKNDGPPRKRPRQQADKENDGTRTKRRKKDTQKKPLKEVQVSLCS